MLIVIPSVLNVDDLAQVRRLIDGATFRSGSTSAGARAARVKNNSEMVFDAAELDVLNRIVMGNLVRHAVYQEAVLPLRVAAPYYASYTEGMFYGPHIDDPVMGRDAGQYRSDVSITIFLNAPQEYEGGALCVETEFGEQSVKLDAGSAVVYPASSLHRVEKVTSGRRLVAVTWAQSVVPGVERRELLYRLVRARNELMHSSPQAAATGLVDQVYSNLVRMWARP